MARRIKDEEQEFEDLSSYSSSKEYKKRRKNKRSRTVLKSIGAVFCVLLILCGTGFVYISTDLLEGLTTTAITKDPLELGIDPNSNIIMDDSIKNIALFGLDARNDDFKGNSDAIMILTVDNKHGKIKMTSILRDSRVPIEGKTLAGEHVNWDTKINAAYGIGGPELAIRTLNQNFGLDIQDYVTINFANMAAIVDAFNGVDLEITADEIREINRNLWALSKEVEDQIAEDQANGTYEEHKYSVISHDDYFKDTNGTVDIESGSYVGGTYTLNGNQAVAYGRIRYVGTDTERAKRQQKVLRGLVERLKVLSFSDYPNLIKQMMPLCATSLELSDIVGLAPILTNKFSMESINVPDAEYEEVFDGQVDEIWYFIYDVTEAAKRISSFIYEDMSPYWDEFGNTADSSVPE